MLHSSQSQSEKGWSLTKTNNGCKSSDKVLVALSKCHNDKYVHCTITMQCQLQHSKQVNKFLSADFYQYQNTESSLASPCSEWHVLELLFDSDDLYMWSQRASFGGHTGHFEDGWGWELLHRGHDIYMGHNITTRHYIHMGHTTGGIILLQGALQ